MESSNQNWRKYELDCQCLNSFSTGNGALKQKLVELLMSRSLQEFKIIRQTYSAVYNREILHVLSNIRRNDPFANVVYLRINEPQDRDAELIRDSLFGWNNDVNLSIIIEVLCTRSSAQLYSIKKAYSTRYGSNIEQDISHKISGNFKEILEAVLKSSNKNASRVVEMSMGMGMAMCDAKTLYEAVESGNCVDWKTIISIISGRNNREMKTILVAYKELYGHEFSRFLKCNKCGNYGKELGVVIGGLQYPGKFLSKQLRGAMKRGSDIKEVMSRIVVTRSSEDEEMIKEMNKVVVDKTGWSLGNLVRREFRDAAGNQINNKAAYALVAQFLIALLKSCL